MCTKKNKKERLGIYGGTFSPPHNGHIHAAESFLTAMRLDRLLIIPTYISPHKEIEKNDPSARLEMTRLAFSSMSEYGESVFVDDYEYRSGGKSYTAKTLEHFSSDDRELFFLCGTDMFLTLGNWYRPDIICQKAEIVLMRRENDTSIENEINDYLEMLKDKYNARISIISAPALEISSTDIRSALSRGEDVSSLVPASVLKFIDDKKIYK